MWLEEGVVGYTKTRVGVIVCWSPQVVSQCLPGTRMSAVAPLKARGTWPVLQERVFSVLFPSFLWATVSCYFESLRGNWAEKLHTVICKGNFGVKGSFITGSQIWDILVLLLVLCYSLEHTLASCWVRGLYKRGSPSHPPPPPMCQVCASPSVSFRSHLWSLMCREMEDSQCTTGDPPYRSAWCVCLHLRPPAIGPVTCHELPGSSFAGLVWGAQEPTALQMVGCRPALPISLQFASVHLALHQPRPHYWWRI